MFESLTVSAGGSGPARLTITPSCLQGGLNVFWTLRIGEKLSYWE